jgi:hypothetical protein
MEQGYSDNILIWLIFIFLLLIVIHFVWRDLKRRAEERKIVTEERDEFLSLPIPREVQKSIEDFRSGIFAGEDQSPLGYVGYRVGKTHGLSEPNRRIRLKVCFRIEIPSELPSKYHGWGRPATLLRFVKIVGHLSMLAEQRRTRRNYEKAVSDWDVDRAWFKTEFDDIVRRFADVGFRQ